VTEIEVMTPILELKKVSLTGSMKTPKSLPVLPKPGTLSSALLTPKYQTVPLLGFPGAKKGAESSPEGDSPKRQAGARPWCTKEGTSAPLL
jgi:hypothetical protein